MKISYILIFTTFCFSLLAFAPQDLRDATSDESNDREPLWDMEYLQKAPAYRIVKSSAVQELVFETLPFKDTWIQV